jgi:hypothetical protein
MAMLSSISSSEPNTLLDWPAKFRRRQLIALFAFLIAFIVADRGFSRILEEVLVGSQFRYSELYRGGTEHDVLIFGNSRGVNGFFTPDMAKELNVTALNLSFNGLSMEMTELLLKDYLGHNSAPRLIILEVTNLHNKGLNSDVLQLYSAVSPRLADAWDNIEPHLGFIHRYIATSHRYSGELFLRVLYYFERSDQDWINRYRIDPEFGEKFRPSDETQSSWSAVIPEDQLIALRCIVALARQHGIELRLVITPYLPNYVRYLRGYEEWVDQVELASGLKVEDWSQAIEDTKFFADPVHMNLDGFRVLFPKISGELRSWLTPDSRR